MPAPSPPITTRRCVGTVALIAIATPYRASPPEKGTMSAEAWLGQGGERHTGSSDGRPDMWRQQAARARAWIAGSPRLLPRMPFSLGMVVGLAVLGVVTGSLFHWLSPAWLDRLGFALDDLISAGWWRLIASAFVTQGTFLLWAQFVVILVVVGGSEVVAGTRTTLVAFWGGHIGCVLAQALVVMAGLGAFHTGIFRELADIRTVGPSAGYVATFGLIAALLPRRFRIPALTLAGVGMAGVALFTAFLVKSNPTWYLDALAHAAAFGIGLSIGERTRRRRNSMVSATAKGRPAPVRSPHEWSLGKRIGTAAKRDWAVWLIAFGVAVNGSLDILHSLVGRFASRPGLLDSLLPFGVGHWSRTAGLVLGFLMVYLSSYLFRRRRVAWFGAVGVTAVAVVVHLVHLGHWPLALAPSAMLVLLLVFRRHFTVRGQSGSIARGAILAGGTLIVAILLGSIGFWLLDRRDFGVDFVLGEAIIRTLRQFVLVGNADLTPHTWHARWFLAGLSVLGMLAAVLAVASFFRPVAYRLAILPRERHRAERVLARYGRSAYDYFKVWPDKSFFFSATGESFVAYRAVLGVALALGDAVGPEEERESVTSAFIAFCRGNGWVAAFVAPDEPELLQNLGLWTFKVGEEARVDLERFASHTCRKKYFRYVQRKFEGEGYTLAAYPPPHAADLLDEAEEVSRIWMTLPHHREFGFVQGTLERSYLERTRLFVVRDEPGRMVAWVNEVPSFAPGEANFDMMRRLPELHWGAMDYLFRGMLLALHDEGYRWFNLGTAPLAGVGEGQDAKVLEKAIGVLTPRLGWLISVQGLKQYKLKFEPVWQDRYLLYDGGPLVLPRIALAIVRAL